MSYQHEYQFVLWAPEDMFDSLTVLAGTTGVRLAEEQTGMTAHQHGYRGMSSAKRSVAMLVDMSNPNECQLALNLALVAVGMGAAIGKAIIPALENGAKRTQEE